MSSLNRIFGQIFNPSRIKQDDEDEETGYAARGLSDIIGSPYEAGINDQGIGMMRSTEATGMHEGASKEMVTQLSQIQGMLQSDSPILQAMGMKEYGEFIKPPPAAQADTGNWRDYVKTTDKPSRSGFSEWLLQQNRSRSGVNWKDETHPDPALAKQFEYVLDGKPLTNETPAQIKKLVKDGIIKYRPDSKAIDLQRAGLGVHTAMDTVNTLMKEILPTLETMPDGLSLSQKIGWRAQKWFTGKVDIELTQGVRKQYATQAPLIGKLLTRNVFQDKGAGSDKDFELSQDFLPVLPGQLNNTLGDDAETIELKLEAINYIIDTLYPRELTSESASKANIANPSEFTKKVQAYHDELRGMKGLEPVGEGYKSSYVLPGQEAKPGPGDTFQMPHPDTGVMMTIMIGNDGKTYRVEAQ